MFDSSNFNVFAGMFFQEKGSSVNTAGGKKGEDKRFFLGNQYL